MRLDPDSMLSSQCRIGNTDPPVLALTEIQLTFTHTCKQKQRPISLSLSLSITNITHACERSEREWDCFEFGAHEKCKRERTLLAKANPCTPTSQMQERSELADKLCKRIVFMCTHTIDSLLFARENHIIINTSLHTRSTTHTKTHPNYSTSSRDFTHIHTLAHSRAHDTHMPCLCITE